MSDMLVPLYNLPSSVDLVSRLATEDIVIRRVLAPEKHLISKFIKEHFSEAWISETETTFGKTPVTCIVAIKNGKIIGFACYDAVQLNFFGPTGVHPEIREQGVGAALLLTALEAQRNQGYSYSIIGGAGPTEFYSKVANAIPIPDSKRGIYQGMLQSPE